MRLQAPKAVALTLDRSGVDALAKDLATLHNYELFKLHDNTKLAQLSVPQQCLFVRKQIFQDYQKLALDNLAPILMQEPDSSVMYEIYRKIGRSIEVGESPMFPEAVNDELTASALEMLLTYIDSAFWNSESYTDFEGLCHSKIIELSNRINTIEDYFYWRIGAEISFGSFYAWVCILSDECDNSKEAHSNWKDLKKKITKFAKDLLPYVKADVDGALNGAGLASVGCAAVTVASGPLSPVVGSGAVLGGAAVGTVVGSVHYNNTHK